MNYKSNLIQQFSERGYIHQATDIDALDALAADHTIPLISASIALLTAFMLVRLCKS